MYGEPNNCLDLATNTPTSLSTMSYCCSRAAVIPAKAGIYSVNLRQCAVDGLDSRFRGNDSARQGFPSPMTPAPQGRPLSTLILLYNRSIHGRDSGRQNPARG